MIFGADVRVALPSVPLALVLELLEQFAYFLVHILERIYPAVSSRVSPYQDYVTTSKAGVMQELASELRRTPLLRRWCNSLRWALGKPGGGM